MSSDKFEVKFGPKIRFKFTLHVPRYILFINNEVIKKV